MKPKTTLVALAVLVGLAGFATAAISTHLVEHRFYQLSEDREHLDGAAIETWSVALPGGYRLIRQQSTPPSPQDGYRFFRPDRLEESNGKR